MNTKKYIKNLHLHLYNTNSYKPLHIQSQVQTRLAPVLTGSFSLQDKIN